MDNITHHPDPPRALPGHGYYQLIHTLTAFLPPPLADTEEASLARNQAAIDQAAIDQAAIDQAAIDQVADMLPTNANEAALAAHCVAARAQADDVRRLLLVHAGDIVVVMKLNAQYVALSRTSFAAHGHLQRARAVRHKREANGAALQADEWTQHVAASSMRQALDAGLVPAAAQAPPAPAAEAPPVPLAEAPPAPVPAPAPVAAPLPAPRLAAAPPLAPAAERPTPPPPAPPLMSAPFAADLPAPVACRPPPQPVPMPQAPPRPPRHTPIPAAT